jgi:hypothetical protein
MRIPGFWRSYTANKKLGFYFAKSIGGWSFRLCLWHWAFCFGNRTTQVPQSFHATLPEQKDGDPLTIIGE